MSTRRYESGRLSAEKSNFLEKQLNGTTLIIDSLADSLSNYISDRPYFVSTKNTLTQNEIDLQERLATIEFDEGDILRGIINDAFEFAPRAYLTFVTASYKNRREVTSVFESLIVAGKKVNLKLREHYHLVMKNSQT